MPSLQGITDQLVSELRHLRFGPPVTHVYNPLVYAAAPYRRYLACFRGCRPEVILLGMNPGPWGMVQTGIPFGEVHAVRDWLGITDPVGKPAVEHPKRPVCGLTCPRSEVSGARLWSWAREHFKTPEQFFRRFFVANYCPLAFIESGGRNRTPDKLPSAERQPLFKACDKALRHTVEHLQPKHVIGIGAFAEQCGRRVLEGIEVNIGRILHPSPANPAANRNWAAKATAELAACGVRLGRATGQSQ